MNKEYPLIYLNGESYMVEDETSEGRRRLAITFHKETGKPALDEYYPDDLAYYVHKPKKLLATTDKSLGLPLLPPIEEDIDELELYIELEEASLEISKSIILDSNVFYAGNPFTYEQKSELRLQRLKDLGVWQKVTGYKANEKQKDDIINLIRQLTMKSLLEATKIYEHWSKSLKPQPIAVEVEIENIGYCKCAEQNQSDIWCPDSDRNGNCTASKEVPKVDKNNFVIVKRWIYE